MHIPTGIFDLSLTRNWPDYQGWWWTITRLSGQSLRSDFLSLLWLLVLLTFSGWSVAAAEKIDLQVEVGIGQTYKVGCWTSVKVSGAAIGQQRCRLEIQTLDADGNQCRFLSAVFSAQENWNQTVPVKITRIGTDVIVRLREVTDSQQEVNSQGKLLAEKLFFPSQFNTLLQSDPWLVGCGQVESLPLTADFVENLEVSLLTSPELLPSNRLCWQGIDVLYLSNQELTAEQEKNLVDWVQSGGRLVLFPNQSSAEFVGSGIVQKLPITFAGEAEIRDLSRLVSFVGEPSPLRISVLTIPRMIDRPGQTLVGGLTGPLISIVPWGRGTVTISALNFNEQVFQNWTALPQMYRILAGLPAESESSQEATSSLLTQNGLTDFKTQWDAGLSNFAIATPTVWISLLGLLLAAIVVGPIDYLLVRKVLNRPVLSWVTFPLLTLLVAGWGASQTDWQPTTADAENHQLARAETLLNQSTVLDYAAETNTWEMQAYAKVLARKTGRYQAEMTFDWPGQQLTIGNVILNLGAVPEASFRGYYRPIGTILDQSYYLTEPHANRASRIPIYQNSTVLLEAQGSLETQTDQKLLTSDLFSSSNTQLRGSLTHQLPVAITDWIVVYGKLVYFVNNDHPLSELPPGQNLDITGPNIRQKELSAFLMGTTTQMIKRTTGVGEDLLIKRLDYDLFSQDLDYILRRLTFHRILGGKDYTKLTNVELISWDYSAMLNLNQAVLVGRVSQQPVNWKIEGQPAVVHQSQTFLRVVMPVEQRGQVLQRLPKFEKDNQ